MLALLLFLAQPIYSTEGVVNAASNRPGPVSPNTIVSIYGKDLADATRSVTPADIRDGMLPTALGATGVRVLINRLPARMFYVSPTQLNVLLPGSLRDGTCEMIVSVDGRAGAALRLPLAAVSPALFQSSESLVIASRSDGTVFTPDEPAKPGDIVILYANGLGDFEHEFTDGQLVDRASRQKRWREFRVELDGTAVTEVHYVGTAPGFAGLSQINFRLPAQLRDLPEIRIGYDGAMSPAGLRLPARP